MTKIQEGAFGSPISLEPAENEDRELPNEVTAPSGLKEKLPEEQLEAGGRKKIILKIKKKKKMDLNLNADTDESPAESVFRGFPVIEETHQTREGGTSQSHPHDKQPRLESKTTAMTEAGHLHKKMVNYMSFQRSEFLRIVDTLNEKIQQLQDGSDPKFTAVALDFFFNESKHHIEQITKALTQEIVDFDEVDRCADTLKGSSASIGAEKLKGTCIDLSRFCKAKNRQACLECLKQIEEEYILVKSELEALS